MITPSQCRAGRGLVNKTQDELANSANVNKRTIMDFESGKRTPNPATLAAIENGLSILGVILVLENGGGAGVRLAKRQES